MRAAIYARVSTKHQTTENQIPVLTDFCQRKGWTLVEIYDEKVSGYKTESERPQFKKMMVDAYQRKFDILVFWKLDRFSRESLTKVLVYLTRLKDYGVHFASFSEPHLDTSGHLQEIIIALMGYFNNQEHVARSERVILGLDRVKKSGRKLGRKTIPHHLIWQVTQLKAKGHSCRFIARQLQITHGTVIKYLKLTTQAKEALDHVPLN